MAGKEAFGGLRQQKGGFDAGPPGVTQNMTKQLASMGAVPRRLRDNEGTQQCIGAIRLEPTDSDKAGSVCPHREMAKVVGRVFHGQACCTQQGLDRRDTLAGIRADCGCLAIQAAMTDNRAAGRIGKSCRIGRAGLHSGHIEMNAAQKRQKGYKLSRVTL
jgi:hypothetical protein